jgi:hypothetical protein
MELLLILGLFAAVALTLVVPAVAGVLPASRRILQTSRGTTR